MNKTVLKYSIGLAAFLLAGTAGFFSITGLAKLFAGTGVGIIILASVLEFSKVITVSYLYRYWKTIETSLKIYLTATVCILMMITSLGIYGYLASGYQTTKNKLDATNTNVIALQNKKQTVDNKVAFYETSLNTYKSRLEDINKQRNNAENRLNKAFDANRFSVSNNQSLNAKSIDKEIQTVSNKIDSVNSDKLVFMDSSSKISLLITQTKLNNESANELGPLNYVSTVTKIPLDTLVSILILLFLFVFDPLAVALIIVFNKFNVDTVENTVLKNELEPLQTVNLSNVNTDTQNVEKPFKDVENTSDIIENTNTLPDNIVETVQNNVQEPTTPRLYNDHR